MSPASRRCMGVRSFHDLRAWQTSRTFKLAIYRLVAAGPLARDFRLRDQLKESAASAVSQVVEGFGRFSPADFARFLAMAKASLLEAQNHLEDAVDRGYISDECRTENNRLAQAALRDVTALLEYLQSPQAKANAERARAKRQARRTQNPEPRTSNNEPEPRTRTRNSEPGTQNRPRGRFSSGRQRECVNGGARQERCRFPFHPRTVRVAIERRERVAALAGRHVHDAFGFPAGRDDHPL